LGEGVLTDLLRIVYENIFSNAPKTLYFARDFLMAGIADIMVFLGQHPGAIYIFLEHVLRLDLGP